jgi:hypothetical protein
MFFFARVFCAAGKLWLSKPTSILNTKHDDASILNTEHSSASQEDHLDDQHGSTGKFANYGNRLVPGKEHAIF